LRVGGLRFEVKVLGFRILGFRVYGSGFEFGVLVSSVQDSGLRV
jgi:hypothetical protein